MAVALRAAGTGTHVSSGTTLTLNLPAGTQEGDYLIAFIHSQASTATVDFAPPAGWTKIGPSFTPNSATNRVTSMFAKFAGSSEASTYVFTAPLTGDRMLGVIHAYTGVNTMTPVAASSGFSNITVSSNTLNVAAFPASSSCYTIQMSTSQFASPYSYALTSYTGGLTLQSEVFRASGATQNPPSEDISVSRSCMRIWSGMADGSGIGAHAIVTAGQASQSTAALICLNEAAVPTADLPTLAGWTTDFSRINETPTPTAGDTAHAATLTMDAPYDGLPPQVGDFYVLVHQLNNGAASVKLPATPAGWTQIREAGSPITAGTMSTGAWYRQLTADDIASGSVEVSLAINNDTGRTSRPAFLGFWVRGAVSLTYGTPQDRQHHAPPDSSAVYPLALTVPNTAPSTKVLGVTLATERTVAVETAEQMQYLAADGVSVQSRWTSSMFQSLSLDSTFLTVSADLTDQKGGQSTPFCIKWPNTHSYNAWAVQLAFESPTSVTSGLTIRRSDGSALEAAYLKVSNGGGALVTPGGLKVVKPGYDSVTSMLASNPFYIAHRGGSRDFPEMSGYAYGQSVLRGYGALEVSLARTSDGVWFGLHDADLNRTSGTTGLGAASAMTWAQVQTYQILGSMAPNNPSQAHRPYMRLEELLALYYPSHVMFLDIKYASAYQAEFISKINALPGAPQDHIVGKAFGVGAGFTNAMHAAGYKTWGYFYESDYTGGTLASNQANWDILGMDYGASTAAWTAVTGYGKPVIGHTCPTVSAKNTAISRGATGLMCSGVIAIVPNTPYDNN